MFEYVHIYSDALLQVCFKFERFKPHKTACHPTKCDKTNDHKLFPTEYCKSPILTSIRCSDTKAIAIEWYLLHAMGVQMRIYFLTTNTTWSGLSLP